MCALIGLIILIILYDRWNLCATFYTLVGRGHWRVNSRANIFFTKPKKRPNIAGALIARILAFLHVRCSAIDSGLRNVRCTRALQIASTANSHGRPTKIRLLHTARCVCVAECNVKRVTRVQFAGCVCAFYIGGHT